ncbi:MAG: c-type cytochrome [Chloroflexi bacterium]|nr:c-type cytochrome [Chloroflexota bacterium]
MRRVTAFLTLSFALLIAACGGSGSSGASSGGGPGDATAGRTFFASSVCPTCHVITGVPSAVGQVGPKLDGIGTTAATRKPGMSAEAYIRESIENPQALISPGFSAPSPMPPNQATGRDLDNLVAYLVSLK